MAETAKSWYAKAILVGAVIAAVLLPVGALGSKFGIWGFQMGFLALLAGTLLAVVGLIAGVIAIFVSRKREFSADGPSLYIGIAVSALIIAVMFVQGLTATSVPPIHNISTDVMDPPQFNAVVALRGEGTNPLEYDADRIAPLQQSTYPGVTTLVLQTSRADALEKAVGVLTGMGLEIVATDADAGIVEATATTFWFGFKDDIVVRVRGSVVEAIVDARSVSRVGVSDLGVNARRIREFLDGMRG